MIDSGSLDVAVSSNGRGKVETSSNSGKDHLHQFRDRVMRRLSFFVPKDKRFSQDESAPVVVLTSDKPRLPDRESFESDSDCACE